MEKKLCCPKNALNFSLAAPVPGWLVNNKLTVYAQFKKTWDVKCCYINTILFHSRLWIFLLFGCDLCAKFLRCKASLSFTQRYNKKYRWLISQNSAQILYFFMKTNLFEIYQLVRVDNIDLKTANTESKCHIWFFVKITFWLSCMFLTQKPVKTLLNSYVSPEGFAVSIPVQFAENLSQTFILKGSRKVRFDLLWKGKLFQHKISTWTNGKRTFLVDKRDQLSTVNERVIISSPFWFSLNFVRLHLKWFKLLKQYHVLSTQTSWEVKKYN